MDFSGIIQKLNELKKRLERVSLSGIEKDIVKAKICDLYLLLYENQEIKSNEIFLQKDKKIEQNYIKESAHTTTNIIPDIPEDRMEQEKFQKKPLNSDYKSLVDVFLEKKTIRQEVEDNSLLFKISQEKIMDLKRSIAMNERFIFIKELFNNDFEAYNQHINYLNSCTAFEQAQQYLTHLKIQYGWDENGEITQHFFSLISRKF